MNDTPDMRLFVFGLGYSAGFAIRRLRPVLLSVAGTTRDPEKVARLRDEGIDARVWDGASGHDMAVAECLVEATHVLVSIAPDAGDGLDPVLAGFADTLAAARPRAIVYLSTIGVYGDHGGAWVDEKTPLVPMNARSAARIDAEAAWGRFSRDTGVPVAILRLSGIYGPGRGPFAKLRAGREARAWKPGQVFNRIHVEDIAEAVARALEIRASGVFNVSDDEPAAPWEVTEHAARLLGREPPPLVPFEEAGMSALARSFWGEVKRVGNERMKRVLGVELRHPTYREGLAATLRAEQAGEAGR